MISGSSTHNNRLKPRVRAYQGGGGGVVGGLPLQGGPGLPHLHPVEVPGGQSLAGDHPDHGEG